MSTAVKAPHHPRYTEMVMEAITSLKERNGSSRQAIVKYVRGNYLVGEQAERLIKLALKKLVESEDINQVKGVGATGSFKVNKAKLAERAQAAKKRKATKKPASKRVSSKKSLKSPAKKVARKTVPKSPKKTAAPKKTLPKSPKKSK